MRVKRTRRAELAGLLWNLRPVAVAGTEAHPCGMPEFEGRGNAAGTRLLGHVPSVPGAAPPGTVPAGRGEHEPDTEDRT
jgi:hypothetical protein